MSLFTSLIVITSLFFGQKPDYKENDYLFKFHRIDNQVDIIVNDSLVYSTGVMDHNPDLKGEFTFYLAPYLSDEMDEVIIKVYNGRPPYDQDDRHWEIEYVITKKDLEFDYMWDEGNNYDVGLVFEETYYL